VSLDEGLHQFAGPPRHGDGEDGFYMKVGTQGADHCRRAQAGRVQQLNKARAVFRKASVVKIDGIA